jgi:hypothetical protein
MRDGQLRRFFLSLTALASPVPLAVACGGTVIERGDGTGGSPNFNGRVYEGAGGSAPVYHGTGPVLDTGGSPEYGTGGGVPFYYGTGGAPAYYGTGGAPTYLGLPAIGGFGGTGGGPIYMGAGAGPIFIGQAVAGAAGAGPDLDGGANVDGARGIDGDACADSGGGPSGCGRRPPGLAGAPAGIGADLRSYFQEMARLEAASIPAFRRLRRELAIHGAPASLRAAALRAARDEVVHTRLGRALAERFGGAYVPPRIGRTKVRSLEELAIDNATEGGVRETFGALMATWQSRAATDAVVRRVMQKVAIDETRHAGLAIRVFEWTERRLSVAALRRVRDARRSCAADVVRELEWTPPAELLSIAGVPPRTEALRLARVMTERLWT